MAITASYAYVRAREVVDALAQDVPLTPRHSFGLVGMWEREGVGRVGIEWYYTDDNASKLIRSGPRASPTRLSAFSLNGCSGQCVCSSTARTSPTSARPASTRCSSSRGADGRWAVDAWAPLDGRNINGGVRLRF